MKCINILGLGGELFSRGLYDLAKQQEAVYDCKTKVIKWPSWKREMNKIMKEVDITEPIVITGHSLGARSAVKLSNELTNKGYNVILLVLLDYVFGRTKLEVEGDVTCYHMMSRDPRVIQIKGANNLAYSGFDHLDIVKDNLTYDNVIKWMSKHK